MELDPTLVMLRMHSKNIIGPGEVARRANVGSSTVSRWLSGGDAFRGLAFIADMPATRLLWWPGVKQWLDANKITYGEPAHDSGYMCMRCDQAIVIDELVTDTAYGGKRRYQHFLQEDCIAALRNAGVQPRQEVPGE